MDYSRHTAVPRPHDLVWIEPDALGEHIAPWALARVAAGQPVVVRRARRDAGRGLPVGVRGAHRGQREAARLEPGRWQALRTPESLAADGAWIEHPRAAAVAAIGAAAGAACLLNAGGWCWGVTGAVGFELATGEPVCHADSDLDVLIRAPERVPRAEARRLARALEALSAPCDAQIETPAGGVALADWAGAAKRVLVKSDAGPFLCADPWSESGSADADRRPSSVAESPSG
ncbi:malonate decarboxylase holo-ACP synthase [Salinisphaera orenii]|uniref:Phosphoribosyl-dephospho-CoA transferase n=1 Tax=Salinisphaera orenii YIM 95161 TaxID=1051139 RepID=A0A423PDP6_9GAMM|nr:malonate decarboxylase holo-ACP synthase [Salinisphaera halophila]ROO23143.1 phosphoribosyl-dephospho-CoA transferase [Salinisphaera halophila YIM 95161]